MRSIRSTSTCPTVRGRTRPTDRRTRSDTASSPRGARLGVPFRTLRLLARIFTRARTAITMRPCRGIEGASPSPAPLYPQGVAWLPGLSRAKHPRGRRARNPATAAADAVTEHLRERPGEPVQTDLAKRGWRCRAGASQPSAREWCARKPVDFAGISGRHPQHQRPSPPWALAALTSMVTMTT